MVHGMSCATCLTRTRRARPKSPCAQVQQGWVQLQLRAEPVAENVERYSRLFADYVALYPALKPIMHRLQEA